MSVNRRDEALNELAEAIGEVDVPDAPTIVRASRTTTRPSMPRG
ncbi:hypothetical protein ACFYSC_35060 [Streptosporangium sp. NPDC004379]